MCADYIPLRVLLLASELAESVHFQTMGRHFRGDASLKSQMRRAAISVASNISEGDGRRAAKDGIRFFRIAIASAHETQTQLRIAGNIGAINKEKAREMYESYNQVCRMLQGLIKSREARAADLD